MRELLTREESGIPPTIGGYHTGAPGKFFLSDDCYSAVPRAFERPTGQTGSRRHPVIEFQANHVLQPISLMGPRIILTASDC